MAVKIRLTRMGRKKKPFYRIVVMDTRAKRDGKFIERLGVYNPMVDPPEVTVNEERVSYWLDTGALISDTVRSLLKAKGIIYKRYLKKKGLSDGEIEEEMKKWEVLQIEKRRKAEKKAEAKKVKEEKEIVVEEVEPEAVEESDKPVEEVETEAAEEADKPAEEEKAEPENSDQVKEGAVEDQPAKQEAEPEKEESEDSDNKEEKE